MKKISKNRYMPSRRTLMQSLLIGAISIASSVFADDSSNGMASGDNAGQLMSLLQGRGLILSTEKKALFDGITPINISLGPWQDTDVDKFKQIHKAYPIVLTLTRGAQKDADAENENESENSDDEKQRALNRAYASGDNTQLYYLYIEPTALKKLVAQSNSQDATTDAEQSSATETPAKQSLAERLHKLLDDDFQQQLTEYGFLELPKVYQQKWRVALGLEEPKYEGGYL